MDLEYSDGKEVLTPLARVSRSNSFVRGPVQIGV